MNAATAAEILEVVQRTNWRLIISRVCSEDIPRDFAPVKGVLLDLYTLKGLVDGALEEEEQRFKIEAERRRALANPLRLRKQPRPGRGGHPKDVYIAIAARYTELRAVGVSRPGRQIATETGLNPSTVRGLVSSCRRQGLLA